MKCLRMLCCTAWLALMSVSVLMSGCCGAGVTHGEDVEVVSPLLGSRFGEKLEVVGDVFCTPEHQSGKDGELERWIVVREWNGHPLPYPVTLALDVLHTDLNRDIPCQRGAVLKVVGYETPDVIGTPGWIPEPIQDRVYGVRHLLIAVQIINMQEK